MNDRFVATVAFLLFLPQVNNAKATGLYDGESKGTATLFGGHCKRASVDFTVKGQVVLGQAKFDGDTFGINGTVTESGAMGATTGFQFLRGQFNADDFQGTFRALSVRLESEGFPKSCQCASLTALIRFGGNNADAVLDGPA
jgi:hypothetical protein